MNVINFYSKLFLGFSEPSTPIMEGIIDFHNYIFFFLVLIFVFVFFIMCNILLYFWYFYEKPSTRWDLFFREFTFANNKVTHGTALEIIWTTIPALILMTIALPSFSLLYSMDEVMMPGVTLKVVGHQWYWSYEYADKVEKLITEANESIPVDIKGVEFDSYMVPEADLAVGDHRLLEVTESVVLPINTYVRILVTSADVLHSFSVNSLGVKVDAVPGRLNQLNVFIKRQGVFYGQCSELCGVSHGMMPIVVRAVNASDYFKWLSQKTNS